MHGKCGWCTVKLLVFSDSHSALRFMRLCMDSIKPDQVIHLGDHYEDGTVLRQEYPQVLCHQVPGNCDAYRMDLSVPSVLQYDIGGVRFYMTHGHLHGVKSGNARLVSAAREAGAGIVLYGHTHEAECYQLPEGLWVMNPGSCRSSGGSVGLVHIVDNKISSCRILRQEDLALIQAQTEKA